jgi:hypothetical protein
MDQDLYPWSPIAFEPTLCVIPFIHPDPIRRARRGAQGLIAASLVLAVEARYALFCDDSR